jgi:hypothetical protein
MLCVKISLNGKWEGMLAEEVMAYFKLPFWYLLGGTDKIIRNLIWDSSSTQCDPNQEFPEYETQHCKN